MPRPYTNDETAPGIKFHATPRNAVIGTLRSDASMQDVGDRLTEAGIAPSTAALPRGGGAVAFLERWGTDSLAPYGEALADARGTLESGATMGVFEVADPDAEAIRRTLSDAGAESLHYFGFPGPTPDPGDTRLPGLMVGPPQHPDEHSSKRPVLLAVDQNYLLSRAALRRKASRRASEHPRLADAGRRELPALRRRGGGLGGGKLPVARPNLPMMLSTSSNTASSERFSSAAISFRG
jgi:hypothetical protein